MPAGISDYPDLPDDWLVVNCCVCGCLLSGRSMLPYALNTKGRLLKGIPPVVSGEVGGRPACRGCREPRPARPARRTASVSDAPPVWDSVMRGAEGGAG